MSDHFDSGTSIVSNADRHCTLITHDSIEQQRNAIVGQCHPTPRSQRERTPHQVTGEGRSPIRNGRLGGSLQITRS
ncbi:MAG: hypothetical protein KBT10_01335 [Bacteroidales bacterium]|nr:hypothetical protein [Candidatus Sodaliphilus aphodohippi]